MLSIGKKCLTVGVEVNILVNLKHEIRDEIWTSFPIISRENLALIMKIIISVCVGAKNQILVLTAI